MKTCVWCRKAKNNREIKHTFRDRAVCYSCNELSSTRRYQEYKQVIRALIVRALCQSPMSSAELVSTIKHVNARHIGGIARDMVVKNLLKRIPHPTERNSWIWQLPGVQPLKRGRPKKADADPVPSISAPVPSLSAVEPICLPATPSAMSLFKRKLNKLKRNSDIDLHGVTEEDLVWQAKYLAQAEWRKQQVKAIAA